MSNLNIFERMKILPSIVSAYIHIHETNISRQFARAGYHRARAAQIMEEMYGDEPPLGIPKLVLVPAEPEDAATYEEWLTHMRGSRVQIRVPLRGDKRELHETVSDEPTHYFELDSGFARQHLEVDELAVAKLVGVVNGSARVGHRRSVRGLKLDAAASSS